MGFYQNLKSDLYRFCHSPLLGIHVLIPPVGILLYLYAVSYSRWSPENKLSGYIQLLSCVFPMLIGIITAMLSDLEEKAGGFYTLLSIPSPKTLPHITKLIILSCFGVCSTLFSLVGFGVAFHILGHHTPGLLFYLQTSLLLFISVFPLYLLHYILSFILGSGYSLGMGIIGALLSALLLTGLGDHIWSFLPWGIAARFSGSLYISKTMGIDFFAIHGMIQSIVWIFIFSVVFLCVIFAVFSRWGGRKTGDSL